jgi:hypothetical protein
LTPSCADVLISIVSSNKEKNYLSPAQFALNPPAFETLKVASKEVSFSIVRFTTRTTLLVF